MQQTGNNEVGQTNLPLVKGLKSSPCWNLNFETASVEMFGNK